MTHARYEMELTSRAESGAPATYRINDEGGRRVGVMYRRGEWWHARQLDKKQNPHGATVIRAEAREAFEVITQRLEQK
ncbi:MAG: hypothetical protein JOY61_08725 [Chloroflexi bacterium]|nr:hypothetical protein [Chloroflexota bacterium]